MTSEGLGEMIEGDSADTCAGKFQLVSMGGLAPGSRMRRPGSEDPHWRYRKFLVFCYHALRISFKKAYESFEWALHVTSLPTVVLTLETLNNSM